MEHAPHSSDHFIADTRVVARRVGHETLLVPVSSGVGDLDSIYMLTEVGSTIWKRLATPASMADMVEAVCSEYDVEPDVARPDVTEFLDLLLAKKLVHNVAETT